jgi:hypothetical protein
MEKTTSGSYFWFVSGWDDPTTRLDIDGPGHALLKVSANDGLSFNDVSSTYTSQFSTLMSYAGICLGNQTGNIRDILIYTAINYGNNWGNNDRRLHKLQWDITSGSVSSLTTLSNSLGYEIGNGAVRMIIGYDEPLNHVLLGGVYLTDFNLSAGTFIKFYDPDDIHSDNHGIYINTSVNPHQIFVGGDGGFYSLDYTTGPSYTPYPLNYGLDISLINGFSGASESNKYVFGQQDITYSGLYEETAGKVTAAIVYDPNNNPDIWENDGGLIDKFDDNRLVIGDNSSYGTSYYVTNSDPGTFANPSSKNSGMWAPPPPPNNPFEPYAQVSYPQTFGCHPFFQAPFRSDRIYSATHAGSLYQFHSISKKFVGKVRLYEGSAHFTNSATYKSEKCTTNCTPDLSLPEVRLHIVDYNVQPVAISFSQLDKNKMYLVTHNVTDPCCTPAASQVIQYIGNDLDDLWWGHNEWYIDNLPNDPQWQLITPDWLGLPFNMAENDVYHIRFNGVETSNWDKNKIYVSCTSDLVSPAPFPYRVITYNGTTGLWDNYSDGIPDFENVTSMIMEHASNDGIYVSTEKGVYYREAGMSAWVSYNTGASGDIMPYLGSRQMEINYKENTVRTGTYGRGIWKSNLVCPLTANLTISTGTVSGYNEADDITSTYSNSTGSTATINSGSTVFRATNKVTLEPGFTADATGGANYFTAFIHGCSDGSSTSSYNYFRTGFDFGQTEVINASENDEDDKRLVVFPNPTSAKFSIKLFGDEPNKIQVYNSFGQIILNQKTKTESTVIDLTNQPEGIYFIKVFTTDNTYTSKIIKR